MRPHLFERLNNGLSSGRKLTIISAPAGFGKTTLVSEWLTDCERPAAWLSLDEGDNDPTRFLIYLISALQTIAPNVGEGVLGILQSPQPPPIEAILTTLLNEITYHPRSISSSYLMITTLLIPKRLTMLSHFCSSISRHKCTWSSPPVRIQICLWLGCASATN